MWQAIKNVATYGGALVFVLVTIFVLSNLACCGVLGMGSAVDAQFDKVGTGTEPTP